MPNKRITLILAGIVVTFFVIYFISLHSFVNKYHMKELIGQTASAAQLKNWQESEQYFNSLYRSWTKGKYLIQLNNGEQQYSHMEDYMERLKAAIENKDAKMVLENSRLISANLSNIMKIIPPP